MATDNSEPEPRFSFLNALNNTEREVLRLLAEGHTAKSIAALTGRSTGAVNERLRDARRKTGVGSSRELARLLRNQINWDEKIEVPSAGNMEQPDSILTSRAKPQFASPRGWFVMIASLVLGAAAALSLLQVVPAETEKVTDPRLKAMLPPATQSGPRELHEQLQRETRDSNWADVTERALRSRYSLHADINGLKVRCARTVCEVVGTINSPLAQMSVSMEDLQTGSLVQDIRQRGLVDKAAVFGPERLFVTY